MTVGLPYVFTFDTLPLNAFKGTSAQLSQDPSGNNYVVAVLTLANAVTQAFAPLATKVQGTDATVNVNGHVHELATEAFSFDGAGTTVTWSIANTGFAIDASDTVTIRYAV
jgi:hypothetical protein